jgi:hypothetical protein
MQVPRTLERLLFTIKPEGEELLGSFSLRERALWITVRILIVFVLYWIAISTLQRLIYNNGSITSGAMLGYTTQLNT